jgi:hypothetical protein
MGSERTNSLTVGRGLLVFGILQLVISPFGCLGAAVLNGTQNDYAEAEATWYFAMAAFLAVAGGLFTFCGVFIRRGRVWAVIFGVVLSTCELFISGLVLLVGALGEDSRLAGTGVVLACASVLMIVQLARTIRSNNAAAPCDFGMLGPPREEQGVKDVS